ncbi:EthD family reductase [Amycolatopsis alkalitolerans]|uniref:EthD family reductase n=1 Tax=Amycolatopsis alkalitolerans TaxID=2547244 RepID=A0A5C4LYU7_9PSEU|nr:EthD family reductase [Amycolatopsis alkalitolerans]TNC24859.1 EthD family reductase [Amycolatopsis alkalitolerans]
MYRMTVVYDHPEDPEKFLKHYREVHAPLVEKLPELRSFGWGVSESPGGEKPGFFVVAVLDWESKEHAQAALASAAGGAAVGDVANFARPGQFHVLFAEVEKVV